MLQREEQRGGAAITEKLSLSTPSSSPAMLTWTDDTHVKGDWFPLHRCSWRPRQWSSTGVHRATSVHPAAVSCAPCGTVHTHPAKHRKQGAVWHPLSACRLRAHTLLHLHLHAALNTAVNDANLHTTVLVHQ